MRYFIGTCQKDKQDFFCLYCDNLDGWELWHEDTFSPVCQNVNILMLKVKGKNYQEKKTHLESLAIEWQHVFSQYSWSYGELATIQGFFYNNAKRYGLMQEFKENAII